MSIAADIQNLATRYPAIAEQVYPHRCSVKRITQVDDGKGGWTDTPSTPYSDIPCTFVPYNTAQRELIIAGQPKGLADGDIWLPAVFEDARLEIRDGDELVIAELGLEPERSFQVVYPAPHQGILIQAAVRLTGNA